MIKDLKSNLIYTAANIYAVVFPFVMGILFRNYVPEEVIGVFVFANTFLIIFDIPTRILVSSMERVLPGYLLKQSDRFIKEYSSTIYSLLTLMNILFSTIIFLIAFIFFQDDDLQRKALYVVCIKFLFDSAINFYKIYFKNINFLGKSSISLVMKITIENIILFAFIFYSEDKGEAYFDGMLYSSVISIVVAYLYVILNRKHVPVKIKFPKWKYIFLKKSWQIGLNICISGTLFTLLFSIDKYYLKHLTYEKGAITNATIAFYSFAAQGVIVCSTIFNSFLGSFTPKIFGNADLNKKDDGLIWTISIISLLFSFFIAASIYLLIDYAIPVVFAGRPTYSATIPYFKILSFALIPLAQYHLAQFLNIAHNRYVSLNLVLIVCIVAGIIANIVFYHFMGAEGICWATTFIAFSLYLSTALNVRAHFKPWYLGLVASAVFIPVSLMYNMALIPIGVLSVIGAVILIKRKTVR